jgi:hypothetical protein
MEDKIKWDNIAIVKDDKQFLLELLTTETERRGVKVKMYQLIGEWIAQYKASGSVAPAATPPQPAVITETVEVIKEKELADNQIIYEFNDTRLASIKSVMKDKSRPEYTKPPRECPDIYNMLINVALDKFVSKTQAVTIK